MKFADADLIGYPVQVVVGKRGVEAGTVDLKLRATGDQTQAPLADASRRPWSTCSRRRRKLGPVSAGRVPNHLAEFVKLHPQVEGVIQHVGLQTWDLLLVDVTGLWVRDEFPTEGAARGGLSRSAHPVLTRAGTTRVWPAA